MENNREINADSGINAPSTSAIKILSNIENSTTPTTHTQSFAQALNKNNTQLYPKKEQALILSPVQGIPLKEYIMALGTYINPTKILYVSRISGNRICIYLKSKEDVTNLTNTHKTIRVQNNNIPIRSLITPSHRIVIWTFPNVPNNIIKDSLEQLGVKVISEMYSLSAGYYDQNFSHIKSFRRFVFVHSDHPTLPETIPTVYENETYRIHITVDEKPCTYCQKFGHISEECRFNLNAYNNEIITNTQTPTLTAEPTHETPNEPQKSPPNTTHKVDNTDNPEPKTNLDSIAEEPQKIAKNQAKRAHSESSSQESESETAVNITIGNSGADSCDPSTQENITIPQTPYTQTQLLIPPTQDLKKKQIGKRQES